MKKCNKCGVVKSLDRMVKKTKTTYSNVCKECFNASRRKRPVPLIPREGYKYCAKCNVEKLLEEFNVRFISHHQEYRPFSYCKECERKNDSERYHHVCSMCGKEYKSGRKDNDKCVECHRELMKQDKVMYKYKERDFSGEKNPMYGRQRFGEENPNYKPHKTQEEREYGRLLEGYGVWRKSVYSRDNYTCQSCFDEKGGNLVAHHLDGYHWYTEGRTNVDNGVTLCRPCHKKFHSLYGNFNNTKEQFMKFKDNLEYLD